MLCPDKAEPRLALYIGDNFMEWYNKFKVGQKVRVVRGVSNWVYSMEQTNWNNKYMDRTIGQVYEIKEISRERGYKLHTQIPVDWCDKLYNYWYPAESLESPIKVGEQLLFSFMD